MNEYLPKHKEHLKIPNHKGLRRKYIIALARLWFSGTIIAGLTVAHCFAGKASLYFFKTKQGQL